MLNSREIHNLEHEGFSPEVSYRSKCDRQVDMPYRSSLRAQDHAMERGAARLMPMRSRVDAHAVEGFGVENVEAAASMMGSTTSGYRPGRGMCAIWSLRSKVTGASDYRRNFGVAGSMTKTSHLSTFEVRLPPQASGLRTMMR